MRKVYEKPHPEDGDMPTSKLDAELLERFYAGCTAATTLPHGRSL